MSKKRTWNKEKPRKLSLIELKEMYSTTNAQLSSSSRSNGLRDLNVIFAIVMNTTS